MTLSPRQVEILAALALRGRSDLTVDRLHEQAREALRILLRLGLVERRCCGGLDPLWHPTPSGREALRVWATGDEELAEVT